MVVWLADQCAAGKNVYSPAAQLSTKAMARPDLTADPAVNHRQRTTPVGTRFRKGSSPYPGTQCRAVTSRQFMWRARPSFLSGGHRHRGAFINGLAAAEEGSLKQPKPSRTKELASRKPTGDQEVLVSSLCDSFVPRPRQSGLYGCDRSRKRRQRSAATASAKRNAEAPGGKPSWQVAGAGCGFSITGIKGPVGPGRKGKRDRGGAGWSAAEPESHQMDRRSLVFYGHSFRPVLAHKARMPGGGGLWVGPVSLLLPNIIPQHLKNSVIPISKKLIRIITSERTLKSNLTVRRKTFNIRQSEALIRSCMPSIFNPESNQSHNLTQTIRSFFF